MSQSDYEIEERAAIREIDGQMNSSEAENLAADDIKQRDQQQTEEGIKSRIKQLQAKSEKIAGEMTALKECERKNMLLDEWMQIKKKVLKLRKELR